MNDRLEYHKQYHEEHREDQIWQMKMRHEEKYNEDIERFKKYHQDNKEKILMRKKTEYMKLRLEVLNHYARDGKIECICCGENEPTFMTIDHINGNGRKHLESISTHLSAWLKKNNYPSGYQILCINCNMGKYRNGGVCPHHKSNPLLTISEEWSSN